MSNVKELLATIEPNTVLLYGGAFFGFFVGLHAAGKVKNALFGTHMTGEQTLLATGVSLAGNAVPRFFMDGANPTLVGFVYGFSTGSAARCLISGGAHPRH
jgi:hypothetical protein